MRSFLDVILDVQDGKYVDKEELRVALLFCGDQLKFSEDSLKRIVRIANGNTNFPPLQLREMYKALENRFQCRKKPMEKWFGGEIPELKENNQGWIPCDDRYPETKDYILLSFENYPVPYVGRYEEDENGGAFYVGDEDASCVSVGVIVNAWMPLPKQYKVQEL